MTTYRANITGFKDDLPLPGVTTCVFSYWNDKYETLGRIAIPNWKAYCEKHNYALRFYPGLYEDNDDTPDDRYGDKVKFSAWYDLRGLFDVLMFLDIDSLFMNTNIRIEDQLGAAPFLWTYDDGGPLSGLIISRTTDQVEKHLRAAYKLAATENNVRHGVIEPHGISDQDAMRRLMHVPPFNATFKNCVSAVSVGHCFPENYQEQDWLVTFPGRNVAEKTILMQNWATRSMACQPS